MGWKPEVKTGNDNKWYGNSVVFETEEEALASAKDLSARWLLVVEHRAVEVDEPANYKLDLKTMVMNAV